jgi:hypothetical protein
MKNFKLLSILSTRVLPALLVVAAGAAFASPALASNHTQPVRTHKVSTHTSAMHAATATTDDPAPKPKRKPQRGHHKKHPPHPGA